MDWDQLLYVLAELTRSVPGANLAISAGAIFSGLFFCILATYQFSMLVIAPVSVGRDSAAPSWRRPDNAKSRPALSSDTLATIGYLEDSDLRQMQFSREDYWPFKVVKIADSDTGGKAAAYINNAVYLFGVQLEQNVTYRMMLRDDGKQHTVYLRIVPRTAAGRFDVERNDDKSVNQLKIAFNPEAEETYQFLAALVGKVVDVKINGETSTAETAWLGLRGRHPDPNVNIAVLFLFLGLPVSVISTLLCKWLDAGTSDLLAISGLYFLSSFITVAAVYLMRHRWSHQ